MKPEAALQKTVLDYLAVKGIWNRRMNSGATVSQYGGKTRLIRYGSSGMGDVLCTPITWKPDGSGCIHVVWLEIKALKGVQSNAQKAFEAEVTAEGHHYIVVRSIEQLEAFLKELE